MTTMKQKRGGEDDIRDFTTLHDGITVYDVIIVYARH
jgi:hypothetical protein